MLTMPQTGSNKNSSSFQSDVLKSNIRFHLTSCNTETIKNLLKYTKPGLVQIQQKNINNTRLRQDTV